MKKLDINYNYYNMFEHSVYEKFGMRDILHLENISSAPEIRGITIMDDVWLPYYTHSLTGCNWEGERCSEISFNFKEFRATSEWIEPNRSISRNSLKDDWTRALFGCLMMISRQLGDFVGRDLILKRGIYDFLYCYFPCDKLSHDPKADKEDWRLIKLPNEMFVTIQQRRYLWDAQLEVGVKFGIHPINIKL